MIPSQAAARRRADPTTQWPATAVAITGDTTPYSLPSAAPYNVPVPALTPNTHGSGQAMHPSVVDFYGRPWNGYRFWMAQTPLTNSNESKENPVIHASHDGYTWEEPAGIVNPIDPDPPGNPYNSDTELAYDPSTDRLICYYRPAGDLQSNIEARWSNNGIDWSDPIEVTTTGPILENLSPAVVRRGPGDWWMFCQNATTGSYGLMVHQSTNPLSGWSGPVLVPSVGTWHNDVIWDGSAFRLIGMGWERASSSDGYTWTANTAAAIAGVGGAWDASLYRATMTVMDDDWMRVWYSAQLSNVWHVGYSRAPRSLWPTAP